MKPFLRKASFPVLYFLFLPGALLHTSTDHVQNSSYTLPLTLLKSSFSALQNIILSTFLLMQLQRQSVRVMKESHLLAGIIINPNRLTSPVFHSELNSRLMTVFGSSLPSSSLPNSNHLCSMILVHGVSRSV